jgi:oxygen-independent coproporphyrinogen-3 oxidase
VNGVHVQNHDGWETYSEPIRRGELPLNRAYRPTAEERLIRELVLQLKRGSIRPAYFAEKYGVDVLARFRDQWASLEADGYLARVDADAVALTRNGLLRVDVLLHRFFLPQHSAIRYT